MPVASTKVLDISYDMGGPDGPPVLLLHGWPDSTRGWRGVTAGLEAAGYRWIAPELRGHGATRFRSTEIIRDGSSVALAQDAFDLADALGLDRFAVVGHDWGGRAAYVMQALQPERLTSATVLAIGYAPRGRFSVPSFEQCQRWWYQWLMTSDAGAKAVRANPIGLARRQWETWSPASWFTDEEFEATARAFGNPDWLDITLHGYRSRWQEELREERYDDLRARVDATEMLTVSTLMIQGGDDRCDPPDESEGQGRHFSGGYRRVVIPGVGHFPAREAASAVTAALLNHLGSYRSRKFFG